MQRPMRLSLVVFLLLVLAVPAAPAFAQEPPFFAGCEQSVFADTGASWVICMPDRLHAPWNGNLVIYVHGYVSPYPERPPEIPVDQYVVTYMGQPVKAPDVINTMGYAFATTSFRTNGLAVKDGTADIMELWGQFKDLHRLGPKGRTFLLGFSEGGLITAKTIEKHQAQFAGGIAACGPIGDFQKQINYMGDMRVAFDYYFKGLLPETPLTPGGSLLPSPIDIPVPLMENWGAFDEPGTVANLIFGTLATYPAKTAQLLTVMNEPPIILSDPATWIPTTLGVLWYDVFAMNDARAKLGGNPYDNSSRDYMDPALNAAAERFAADRNALAQINAQYQTTGRLKSPLVTLHNVGDPVVPYWHEVLYAAKVAASGSDALHLNIPVDTFGHCNFAVEDIQQALAWLMMMSGG